MPRALHPHADMPAPTLGGMEATDFECVGGIVRAPRISAQFVSNVGPGCLCLGDGFEISTLAVQEPSSCKSRSLPDSPDEPQRSQMEVRRKGRRSNLTFCVIRWPILWPSAVKVDSE